MATEIGGEFEDGNRRDRFGVANRLVKLGTLKALRVFEPAFFIVGRVFTMEADTTGQLAISFDRENIPGPFISRCRAK